MDLNIHQKLFNGSQYSPELDISFQNCNNSSNSIVILPKQPEGDCTQYVSRVHRSPKAMVHFLQPTVTNKKIPSRSDAQIFPFLDFRAVIFVIIIIITDYYYPWHVDFF